MRRVALAAALLVAVVIAIALAVHAPPVRRAVLRYVVTSLEERLRLRVDAGRLDYNLATLTVSIRRLRVAANHSPDVPFFEADSVSVRLPRSAIGGPLAFDDIAVQNGRVRVVRTTSGSNLPLLDGPVDGEPDQLRINQLTLPSLAVTIQDEVAGLSIAIPMARANVSPADGRLTLGAPATIVFSGRTLHVSNLDGGVTFDGRTATLRTLRLTSPELTMVVEGTLGLLTRDPGMRLRVSGTGDLGRLWRWVGAEADMLHGTASVEGTVEGAFGAPVGDLRVRSAMVNWQRLSARDVQMRARIDGTRLDVADARFALGDGLVSAAGRIDFGDEGVQEINARWQGIDIEALAGSLADASDWLPTGKSDGELQARTSDGVGGLVAGATVRLTGGTSGPRRISLPGESRIRVVDGRWQLQGRHEVATLAPATIDLRGRIPTSGSFTGSYLEGLARIDEVDVATTMDALETLGILNGEREWTASGRLRAEATLGGSVQTPRWKVLGDVNDGQVSFQEGRSNVEGRFEVVGARTQFSGRLAVQYNAAHWRDLTIGDGSLLINVDNDEAAITATAQRGLSATGTIATTAPYISNIDASLEGIELSEAAQRFQRLEPLTGQADVAASFRGPLAAWREGTAFLEVQLTNAAFGALPLDDDVPLQLSYAANRITAVGGEFRAGGARIAVSGGWSLDGPTSDVFVMNASGDLGDFVEAAELAGLIELPVVGGAGPVRMTAHVHGPAEQPRVSGSLDLGPGAIAVEDLPLVTDIRLRASLADQTIQVDEFAARYQGATATATGSIPLAWAAGTDPSGGSTSTPAVLSGRVVNVGPAVLEPFLDPTTLADLEGSLDLSVDVNSPSARVSTLTGRATLDRMDVRLAGLPLTQQTPTAITFGDGFARIESWAWAGQGARLSVAGQVRLEDLQSGLLATGEIDGRMLTPFIRDAGLSTAGRLTPRLSISGSLAAPRVDGDVAVAEGELRLVEPRVIVTDLQGRVVLSRSTATLTSFRGNINGGTLDLSGSVEMAPRDAIRGSLSSVVRDMPIEFPDGLRSEIDADLAFAATRTLGADVKTTSSRLSGTVNVLRGAYREPLAVLGGALSAVQARGAETARPPSPFLDNLTLDVRIVTDDDLIVDNNTARLAAGADLRAVGTAATPGLSGRADLREGGRIFLGRNVYTITTGRIDFTDPATVRPEANIELTTRVGGEEIEVTLTGPLDAPAVTLASSNPDLSQADLTALLVTGRRFDQLASADAALIGTTVVGNLAGDVLGFAGRAVGLDTLRLGGEDTENTRGDLTAVAAEVDPTSRLTFGKSIGSNFEVTLSQNLRDGDAQTWIIDYLPSRRILLRLVSNDEDLRSYAFRHDVVVGAPFIQRQDVSVRPAPGRVVSVTLTGDLGVEEPRLRDLLRLEEGDRFDFIAWQDDRERLEQFYRSVNRLAARINASRADEGGGVALTYAIAAGPETRIVISGWTSDEETTDRIRDAWSIAIVDDLLEEEAQAIVTDALTERGYLRPAVSAAMISQPGVSTLSVDVMPGPQTLTARVTFTGITDETARELGAWSGGAGALQAVRNPSSFETAVAEFLRGRGHLDAQVRVGAPSMSGTMAEVPVVINTGAPVIVQSVAFTGSSLPEERLTEVAALEVGAPLDPAALEEARTRLLALHRREGFPAVEISTSRARDAITFNVSEGAQQVIADIDISGRGRIDADVVTRALQLTRGAPARGDDLLAARRRLFETGLFRRVDVTTEPLAGPSAASASTVPMRVRVSLEEWPLLRLRYGVELAEERPDDDPTGRDLVPGVSADITRRTLFGRPIAVGVAGRYQKRQRRGNLFVSSPTFLSLPLESSLTFDRSREEFAAATLLTDVTGIAWEQRVRLLRHLQVSYAYRYERNHTFETNPTPDDALPDFDLTVHLARLLGSVSWDTRSQPDDPVRGTFASGSLEWTPSTVGSDFQFFRYVLQGYRFTPWRGVVLASAARFGSVQGVGGQEVIPSERFYAGGGRSVRGVSEDGLGERDFFGDPAGGEVLLVLNQEARFPIYRWLRGVGFVDAGNVFRTRSQFSLGDLTVSLGGGLRLATPFALLRADVARVLETGGSRWSFGIGHAF